PGDDARERPQTALFGLGRRHQHDGRRPVVDAGGGARGNRAVLVEGGTQLRQHIDGRAVLGMLVGVDDRLAAAGRDLDRYDLVLEAAGLLRRLAFGLRPDGTDVLL